MHTCLATFSCSTFMTLGVATNSAPVMLCSLCADTQYITKQVAAQLELLHRLHGVAPTTRTAAYITRRLCYDLHRQRDASASLICAGADGAVYSIPSGGSIIKEAVAFSGSGSSTIMAHCDAAYRADFSKEACIAFVEQSLRLAISRDSYSGGDIVMLVLSATGIERIVRSHSEHQSQQIIEPFAWR